MKDNKKIAFAAVFAGIVLIIYPYLGQATLSRFSGLILLCLCLLIFLTEFNENSLNKNAHKNKNLNFIWLAIALFSLLFGTSLMLNAFLYNFISGMWLLLSGILLGLSGALIFYYGDENKYKNNLKIILLFLGLAYILMGIGIINPMYLGIFIGLALIYYGYLLNDF